MHPIHSDLVAGTIRTERLRAAAAHHDAVSALRGASDADHDDHPSFVRRALSWFRGAAHIDLRHHHA